jgi:hypothetical protein
MPGWDHNWSFDWKNASRADAGINMSLTSEKYHRCLPIFRNPHCETPRAVTAVESF